MPTKKKVDPAKFYSLLEIEKGGYLKGITPGDDRRKLRAYVAHKFLKAVTMGEGRAKRYFVKGKDLLDFISKWEKGEFANT